MKNVLSFYLLILASQSLAAKIDNLTFPDSLVVEGQTLKLNGIGLRKATVFKVKVYGAALYVNEPTHKSSVILKSTTPKVLIMKFLRDVSKEKINDAWDSAFEKNSAKYHEQTKKLKSLMPDAKEGDSIEYLFLAEKTEVKVNQTLKGSLEGGDWGQALLATWLGDNPPTEELKNGLLGVVD